jgi:hypothetical protein
MKFGPQTDFAVHVPQQAIMVYYIIKLCNFPWPILTTDIFYKSSKSTKMMIGVK